MKTMVRAASSLVLAAILGATASSSAASPTPFPHPAPTSRVSSIYVASFQGGGVSDGTATLTLYHDGTAKLAYTASTRSGAISGVVRGTSPQGIRDPKARGTAPRAIMEAGKARKLGGPAASLIVDGLMVPTAKSPGLLRATLKIKIGGRSLSFKPSFIGFTPETIGFKNPDIKVSSVVDRGRKCTLVVATSGGRHVTLYAIENIIGEGWQWQKDRLAGSKTAPTLGRIAGRAQLGGGRTTVRSPDLTLIPLPSPKQSVAPVAVPGLRVHGEAAHAKLDLKTKVGKLRLRPRLISLGSAGLGSSKSQGYGGLVSWTGKPIKSTSGWVHPALSVGFNPQPEPPGYQMSVRTGKNPELRYSGFKNNQLPVVISTGVKGLKLRSIVAPAGSCGTQHDVVLYPPQPGKMALGGRCAKGQLRLRVSFNQGVVLSLPLDISAPGAVRPAEIVGFNPQPEPPGTGTSVGLMIKFKKASIAVVKGMESFNVHQDFRGLNK